MKENFRKKLLFGKLKDRAGAAQSLEALVSLALLLMVFSVALLAIEPGVVKVNLDNYTKNLVRQIEIHGVIDSEIESYSQALAVKYGLNPVVTYSGDFIPGTQKIQIRSNFSVTVEQEVEIKMFTGGFSVANQRFTMVKTLDGMSEVLWK